ncbi:hypothetical protein L1F30_12265 [Simiduia sp. 21SJ11W-1]|uniref:hypothetical protein n=1 Tax=Simiduia sp. 21SJ11W-1 TaxID=2909669 RepID=UPI00209EE7D4|nr:hypothetical protein [Simiduia sp. 21SJ11W-1]UTA46935.1 hypothetical protein L1F30_12265 [Simiduia sp. 21SJ11W-1]
MNQQEVLSFTANQSEAYIFSLESLLKEASEKLGKSLEDFDTGTAKTLGGFYSPAQDLLLATKIMSELGINGQIVTKRVNNKTYIILKGNPGLRQVLRGTRYLASNPKIIKFAIGTQGVNRTIAKGGIVTLLVTIPLSVVDIILQDSVTVGKVVGTISTDIAKVLVSAGIGSLAAMAVGAVTTLAAGPLIAAIFVGIAASVALESLDQKYGITDKLIKAIDDELNSLYNKTIGEFVRGIRQVEAVLEYQIRNGLPVGRGIFY